MMYVLTNKSEVLAVLECLTSRLTKHRKTLAKLKAGEAVCADTRSKVAKDCEQYNSKLVSKAGGGGLKAVVPIFLEIEGDDGGSAVKRMAGPLKDMGAINLFYGPGDNQRRNEAKGQALKGATGQVIL